MGFHVFHYPARRTLLVYCRRTPSLPSPTISYCRSYSKLASSNPRSGQHEAQLASGQEEAAVTSKLHALLQGQHELPHQQWQLILDGKGIQRDFKFKTFSKAWVSGLIDLFGYSASNTSDVLTSVYHQELHASRSGEV